MTEYVLPFNTGTSKEPNFTFLDPISRAITTGRIFINGDITGKLIEDSYNKFLFFKDNAFEEIYVFINSNGGDASATNQLLNLIKFSDITINTVCTGVAKSAGATILMSGTKGHRFAMPGSEIMIHSITYSNLPGLSSNDLKQYAKDLDFFEENVLKHMSKMTGKTVAFIKKAIKNKDLEMTPLQAKKFGIIDHIVTSKDYSNF